MTDPLAPSPLPMLMFSSAAMRAVVDGRARLQRMLDFETALARAAAAVGAIPPEAVGRAPSAKLGKSIADQVIEEAVQTAVAESAAQSRVPRR